MGIRQPAQRWRLNGHQTVPGQAFPHNNKSWFTFHKKSCGIWDDKHIWEACKLLTKYQSLVVLVRIYKLTLLSPQTVSSGWHRQVTAVLWNSSGVWIGLWGFSLSFTDQMGFLLASRLIVEYASFGHISGIGGMCQGTMCSLNANIKWEKYSYEKGKWWEAL